MVRRLFGNPPSYPSNKDDAQCWYDVMQVCRNGHKITDTLKFSPQHGRPYCSDCGAGTMSKCQQCEADIQGYYHMPGYYTSSGPKVPAFCHACGKPYPWTESRLKAAQELADELEHLSEEERKTLKASLDDLVRDTPGTTLAATRFKRLAAKAGKGAAEAFKDTLIGVISEAARKVIWP